MGLLLLADPHSAEKTAHPITTSAIHLDKVLAESYIDM
jgi:hypothetical protein